MKEQLALLIETYAAARASGDVTLQRFATQQLNSFLQGIDISPTADDKTVQKVGAEKGEE